MKKVSFEWKEEPFLLFGLRSNWESFRLAFHLNRALQIRLRRAAMDLDCYHEGWGAQACYPHYAYFDEVQCRHWALVENRARIQQAAAAGLFEVDACQVYLIPERKEIDCFLKVVQAEESAGRAILSRMASMGGLQLAVEIDAEQLKSKRNLIF